MKNRLQAKISAYNVNFNTNSEVGSLSIATIFAGKSLQNTWLSVSRRLPFYAAHYKDSQTSWHTSCSCAKFTKLPRRHVLSCTALELLWIMYWSKWLNFWFQQLTPSVPTYLKNGDQLLNDVLPLKRPLHVRLFTTDTHWMNNNIDTEHAIEVITWWIKDFDCRGLLLISSRGDTELFRIGFIAKVKVPRKN